MKRRSAPLMVGIFLGVSLIASEAESLRQNSSIPAELMGIDGFADKLEKNPRGFWEATLKNGLVLVYIPAGEFLMGSPRSESGGEKNEGPVHRVYIKGFWIGKFEVTRAIWRAFMGNGTGESLDPELPQGSLSHDEIQKFLRILNEKSGLMFRLPTEAEWEKCCRGGNPASRYGPLDEIAWTASNSGGHPHPVGTKRPNGFGLFDMLGNVWEWCSDWYASGYYESSPYSNPAGPDRGKRRVCRGGGYLHDGTYLRSAHRNNQDPKIAKPYLGFRLALDPPR
jgi:formylglycine-generating enzyme required for sulfatase activity